jgi:acyl-coenzyme A thioesterase PaaI-like protein
MSLGITNIISQNTKKTWLMRAFGLTKVPLLFICSPKILRLDDKYCEVLIPFRKIVKNHLGSVYFGALSIGADTCVGMLAYDKIQNSSQNISFVFKDFKANFLKRAEGDTHFICESGELIQQLIDEVLRTGERCHKTIPAKAYVRNELVAEFELTLSLKVK